MTSCRRYTYEYTNSTFTTKLDISETKKFPYVIFENSDVTSANAEKRNNVRTKHVTKIRHETLAETTCVLNT